MTPDFLDPQATPSHPWALPFMLVALVIGGILSAGSWLLAVVQPPTVIDQAYIDFLLKCVYGLCLAIVAIMTTAAAVGRWIADKALAIIQENSRSNQLLTQELIALKEIQQVQMEYFNEVGITAIQRALEEDAPEIPADIPLAAASTRRPLRRRHPSPPPGA